MSTKMINNIDKLSKSTLAIITGAALAISSLLVPTTADAADINDEPTQAIQAMSVELPEAEHHSPLERIVDFFDGDEPEFEAPIEAAVNPISLPAPRYVTPADRIPVNEAPRVQFETVSNVGRSMSPTGIALLKELEGLELTGYVLGDGMCTIGYGHAEPLSVVSAAACRQWTITEAEAEAMLREDVQIYADAVGNHFTRPLTQNQFDALTSFIYNVGTEWMNRYDWGTQPEDHSITGAMMLAVYPAKFKEGLTMRRNAEIALFYLDSETA